MENVRFDLGAGVALLIAFCAFSLVEGAVLVSLLLMFACIAFFCSAAAGSPVADDYLAGFARGVAIFATLGAMVAFAAVAFVAIMMGPL